MSVNDIYKAYKNKLTAGLLENSLAGALLLLIAVYGCSDSHPPARPASSASTVQSAAVQQPAQAPLAELLADDTSLQQGYIYERNNRRDPFVPLILPTKQAVEKKKIKEGTLESYDLNEFVLAAIAKMGTQYYALLVTPDSRSFTVYKGTRLGLNKGKVKDISDRKIVLFEEARDYKGTLKPREIILEFIKGEGKQ